MRIWHISDTHSSHGCLNEPDGVDIVIHSGDCSNSRDSAKNSNEVLNFLEWFESLKSKHKVFIAGNHDVSIERRLITPQDILNRGIVYLENSEAMIEGLKIWGSPITPSFGQGWAWNVARHKMHNVWSMIPEGTDILVTHGPPRNFLDLSEEQNGEIKLCGCKSLESKIYEISPMLSCFGHVHDSKRFKNSGLRKLSGRRTIYSNGSVAMDGCKEVINNGNLIDFIMGAS